MKVFYFLIRRKIEKCVKNNSQGILNDDLQVYRIAVAEIRSDLSSLPVEEETFAEKCY